MKYILEFETLEELLIAQAKVNATKITETREYKEEHVFMNLTRIILYKESNDIGDGILLNAWIPFNEKYFVKDSTLKELDTAQRKYEICKHQLLSPEEELILKLHKKEFLKQQALEG